MMDKINTFEEQEPNREHDVAMLKKAEKLEQNANPDRPDWLPEKFKTAEDLSNAYSELEKKLGQTQSKEVEQDKETTSDENAPDENASDVAKVLDQAGLDFNMFEQEYNSTGEISSEAYKALDEAGFPKNLVDSWIAGQEALATNGTEEVYNAVGGADQYTEILEWASESLSPSEVEAFNSAVDTGSTDTIMFAVKGLQARYRSENGVEPNLIKGQNTQASSGGSFSSVAQVTAAMRDPRYTNDPAYRKTVTDRLARSNVL